MVTIIFFYYWSNLNVYAGTVENRNQAYCCSVTKQDVFSHIQFASRISGMRFCESSAKDNFNVDEIFLKLVDDILSKVGSSWGSLLIWL